MAAVRTVTLGIQMPYQDHRIADAAARYEALGWDLLGVGEHMSFFGPFANGFISLAAMSSMTRRVKLMSNITLLPAYPAMVAAKMAAALDNVSNGRYWMGVGIGGENPRELEACGISPATRGRRVNEALTVMKRLWTEPTVTFEGEFARFDRIDLAPKPVQQPCLPVWIGGRKDVAMRRAAIHGDGWLPYMYSAEMLAGSIARIAELRDPALPPIRSGMLLWTCAHQDRATALEFISSRLKKVYRQDFDSMIDRYLCVGTPEDCVRRAMDYVNAGADLIVFAHGCPESYWEEHAALLAREVVPAIREAVGATDPLSEGAA